MSKRLSQNLIVAILCLTFLLICFNYSSKINLWGDEAYSLQLVAKSWQQIFTSLDVHLPTYYFLLKILTIIFNDSQELILRLAHAVLFSIGLFLGYKTTLFLSGSTKKSLLVLLAAIVSPTFLFYATNLRMYSLLFLFSMGYIYYLSQLLLKKGLPTRKEWLFYWLISAGLMLIDYPGVVVFLVGLSLMIFKLFKLKKFKLILFASSPLLALTIYSSQILPGLLGILTWGSGSKSEVSIYQASLFELGKLIYYLFSPVFELVASSQEYWVFGLVFPALLAFSLFLSLLLFIIKPNKTQVLKIWIVICFAFYWLISLPLGYSLTRAFLPALFFMPAFLLLAEPWLPKIIGKLNLVLFALLVIINFSQILNPTLHFYSLIPYKAIALETIKIAKTENISQIYLSDNSLNNIAVKQYLEKNSDYNLKISWLSPDFKPDSLKQSKFIFVSHLGESNNFVDYQKLAKNYQVSNANNYTRLDSLPYNDFRIKQIQERAFQDHAISVYLVKELSP